MKLRLNNAGIIKFISAVLVLGSLILALGGCAAKTTTATTTSIPTEQTLKIGVLEGMASQTGIDVAHSIQVEAGVDNQNGGMLIGGQRYYIQLVEMDAGTTVDAEVTAANRMIYQEKVNFIIEGGGAGLLAVIPLTESNKVILMGNALMVPKWDPQWQYTFDGAGTNAASAAEPQGWLCQQYPDLVRNTVVVYPDDQIGNMISTIVNITFQAFGVTPKLISFPATLTDLSSVATKIMSMNPGVVFAATPSPATDGLIANAVVQAGYKGIIFTGTQMSTVNLAAVMSPQALSQFICPAAPTEFTPPLTQVASDFMNAWIERFGSWTDPNLFSLPQYYALRAALQKAGSIDTTAVAAALSSGLAYETPLGSVKMISRPDIGVSRTVNSVMTITIKKIVNGQAVQIGTVTISQGETYLQDLLKFTPASKP